MAHADAFPWICTHDFHKVFNWLLCNNPVGDVQFVWWLHDTNRIYHPKWWCYGCKSGLSHCRCQSHDMNTLRKNTSDFSNMGISHSEWWSPVDTQIIHVCCIMYMLTKLAGKIMLWTMQISWEQKCTCFDMQDSPFVNTVSFIHNQANQVCLIGWTSQHIPQSTVVIQVLGADKHQLVITYIRGIIIM